MQIITNQNSSNSGTKSRTAVLFHQTIKGIAVILLLMFAVIEGKAVGVVAPDWHLDFMNNPCQIFPVITANGPTTFCQGGSVTLDGGNYSGFLWSDGSTNETLTVSSSGTYSVTVTDASGCTGSASQIVTVDPLLTSTISGSNVTCAGRSDGQVTVIASGGAISNTNTYLMKDANLLTNGFNIGCGSGSQSYAEYWTGPDYGFIWNDQFPAAATITNIELESSFFVNCNGLNPRTVNINDNPAGTIIPYNTDCSGCASPLAVDSANLNSGFSYYNLSGLNTLKILLNWVNFEGIVANSAWSSTDNVYARVRVTATLPVTYAWNTVPVQTTATATGLTAGNYCVTITDYYGCTTTACYTVGVDSPAPVITANGPTTFCQGSSVTLDAGNFSSYSWSDGSTNETLTTSVSGNYSVTVTNSNGCTGTATQSVTVNPDLIASVTGTTVSCIGQNTGQATVIVSGGASSTTTTYLMNDANLLLDGFNIGCGSGTQSYAESLTGPEYGFIWTDRANPNSTVTNIELQSSFFVNCNGLNPRTVNINDNYAGAIIPYNTDCSGCASPLEVDSANLNNGFSYYNLSGSNTLKILLNWVNFEGIMANPSWSNSDNVYAKVLVTTSLPVTYAWNTNPVQTTATATGLSAGNYCVTVTDYYGCTTSACYTVEVLDNQPPVITVPNNISVNNDANSCSAVVTFSGPTATDNCSDISNPLTFNYSGSTQSYTVPVGVTSILVNSWGAGGGGGGGDGGVGGTGGGGSYAFSAISVNTGDILSIYVGGAGGLGNGCVEGIGGGAGGFGYGNGGNGGNSGGTGCSGAGGGGGGASAVLINNNPMVIAAGGGGGGGAGNLSYYYYYYYPSFGGAAGGGGQNGNAGGYYYGGPGYAGASGNMNGTNGYNQYIYSDGGGAGAGGGGLFGGSGGGTESGWDYPGGGGGGGTSLGSIVNNGNGQTPGNAGALGFCPSCGQGGNGAPNGSPGYAGGNGVIIIQPNPYLIQTSGLTSGSSFPVGTTTNTYLAVDGSGNTTTNSFTVTVTDDQAPVIGSCPSDITQCGVYVAYFSTPYATDNCSVNVNANYSSGSTFPTGTTTVTFTATDPSGNTATCSFNVTIYDNPVVTISGASTFCSNEVLDAGVFTSYIWNDGSTNETLSVSVSGTYSVTVNDFHGCNGTASINVTNIATPTITANSSTTFCIGGSVTLDAGQWSAYNWSNNINTETNVITSSGTYIVTVTDANGCTGTSSQIVAVNPLPVVSAGSDTSLCLGNSVTLVPSGANTYVWNNNTGSNTAPLDNVSGATLALGLRKLSSNYNGNALQLIRYSDYATMDFGFAGNDLDITSIQAWLNGEAGYCTVLYDQSGNGGDVHQDYGNPPMFVVNGLNGKPTLNFNANNFEFLDNGINYPAPFTVIYGSNQTGPNYQRVLSSVYNNWLLGYWAGDKDQAYYDGWVSNDTDPSDNSFHVYSGAGDGTAYQFYHNGSLLDNNTNGTDGPNGIELNGTGYGSELSDCNFSDVIIFGSVLSNNDRTAVENSISSYIAMNLTVAPTTNATYTVVGTDVNGCVNSSSVNVTVNTAPSITSCPGNITQNIDAGQCTAVVSYSDATAGGSPSPVITYSQNSGTIFPVGTTTVTVTATNECGAPTCSFTVTVNDNEVPVLSGCSNITTSDLGNCNAVVTFNTPTATDNCGISYSNTFNYTGSVQSFTVPSGITSIIVNAWGAGGGGGGNDGQNGGSGGGSAYSANQISVNPGDILTVYVGGGGNGGATCATGNGGGTGGFGYGAGGNGGNTGTSGCSGGGGGGGGASGILNGNNLLVLAAGGGGGGGAGNDVIAGAGGGGGNDGSAASGGNSNGGTAGSSVNNNGLAGQDRGCSNTCDGGAGGGGGGGLNGGSGGSAPFNNDASGGGGGGGLSYGNSANGNGQTPGNSNSLIAICSTCGNGGGNTQSGGNGVIIISYSNLVTQTAGLSSGSTFPVGSTTNTFSITDVNGNTSTCSFNVVVTETSNPLITCIGDQIRTTDNNVCTYTVSGNEFDPSFSDNCPNPTIAYSLSGATIGSGSNTLANSTIIHGSTLITWTVTDGGGNTASCSFNLTVNDNQVPVISCPSAIAVNNDGGNCSAIVTFTTPVGTDNCSGSVTTQNSGYTSGYAFPVGTTTNAYLFTDIGGNTATCSFTVTVSDAQVPVITCPSSISVSNDAGNCSALITFTTPVGTDNCSGSVTSQTSGNASGYAYPIGTSTNVYLVTDGAGNTATCSFTVTVSDTQVPVITCPSSISVSNDLGNCSALVTYTTPVGTDNCSGASTSQTSGHASGFAFPIGTTTNAFKVTDNSGNNATCSFTVTVTDTLVPVITCPSSVSVNNDGGNCSAVVTFTTPVGTDNCAGASTSQTSGHASGYAFTIGTTTNSFKVTDNSGNTATCSFTITVTDNQAPVISCPSTITISTDANTCTSSSSIGTATATDNCSATVSHTPAGPYAVGTTIVIWKATDASGNTATCSQSVTVLNPVSVSIIETDASGTTSNDGTICNGSSAVLYSSSAYSSYSWSGNAGNTRTITVSPSSTTPYTLTVSNGNGCTGTATQTITVISNPTAGITGTATACNLVTLTATGGDTYAWSGGSSTNTAINTFSSSGNYSVTVTNGGGCSATTSQSVTVNSAPAAPGAITGNTAVCHGTSNTYIIATVSGATSYTWTLPSGWSGTSTTTSIVTTAGNSGGTISVTANNNCGSSNSSTMTVTVSTGVPSTPGFINGNSIVCLGSIQAYTIASVSGATSYTWTLPNGWTGTSTTTSITTTVGSSTGFIKVKANNACGSSIFCSFTIAIVNTAPSEPGSISGSNTVCSGSNQSYHISSVSGATSYTWTLPSGWSGTSTSTSISTTAGNSGGTISVTANNSCGSSAARTLSITVTTVPPEPGTISGNTHPCTGSIQTYTIASVAGATGYVWSTPAGWSGTSTTTSITVTIGLSSGNLTVFSSNSCGYSTSARSLGITVAPTPAEPGTISGNTNVCVGSHNTYTISPVSGANSYTWTTPSGWTGTSSTTSIATTAGTSGGSITVKANNACGSGPSRSLSVTINVITQVTITSNPANDNYCSQVSPTYVQLIASSGYNSYSWTPSGGNTRTATVSSVNSYTVNATNSSGCTTTASVSVTNNCALPTGLVTNSIEASTAKANWTTSQCAVNYTIEISKHGLNNWTSHTVTGTNYTFTGLLHHTSYDWKIQTNCNTSGSVNSGYSAIQTFTTESERMTEEGSSNNLPFSIYPNPADVQVTISFSTMEEGTYSIKLVDMMGRVVKSELDNAGTGDNTYTMNLDGIAKGVYMVVLQQGDTISKGKLVVE